MNQDKAVQVFEGQGKDPNRGLRNALFQLGEEMRKVLPSLTCSVCGELECEHLGNTPCPKCSTPMVGGICEGCKITTRLSR